MDEPAYAYASTRVMRYQPRFAGPRAAAPDASPVQDAPSDASSADDVLPYEAQLAAARRAYQEERRQLQARAQMYIRDAASAEASPSAADSASASESAHLPPWARAEEAPAVPEEDVEEVYELRGMERDAGELVHVMEQLRDVLEAPPDEEEEEVVDEHNCATLDTLVEEEEGADDDFGAYDLMATRRGPSSLRYGTK